MSNWPYHLIPKFPDAHEYKSFPRKKKKPPKGADNWSVGLGDNDVVDTFVNGSHMDLQAVMMALVKSRVIPIIRVVDFRSDVTVILNSLEKKGLVRQVEEGVWKKVVF
ncbi:MAG: hypothetical protein AAGM67_07860 [Bacteroidota bacterium]